MTYQDKLDLIKSSQATLENGGSWTEFQTNLAAVPDFYPKDITNTSNKVITALEARFGDQIDEQLNDTGEVAPLPGLHPSVQDKLVNTRKKLLTGRLSRKLANRIMQGEDPKLVIAQNGHPLMTQKVIEAAVAQANHRREAKADAGGSGGAAGWVIAVIVVFIIRLVLRMMDN